ncbi:MAG: winged helix-turn-helix domain-containing protein [Paraglaciecola sp.]|uniref:winged helix-turn-helix domain-containing protein n=2 Tax=Paraglaciecola sp. TaxID=1920173 RepID=UPI003262F18B
MEVVTIGDCQLDNERSTIERFNIRVSLTEKSALLLKILAAHDGHEVSRQTLIDEIWKGSVVSDDSLTNLVSLTRQKLKKIEADKLIKTLPKRGYRLNFSAITGNKKTKGLLQPQPVPKSKFSHNTLFMLVIAFVCVVILGRYVIPIDQGTPEQTSIGILPGELTNIGPTSGGTHFNGAGLSSALLDSMATHTRINVVSNRSLLRAWSNNQSFKMLFDDFDLEYVVESHTIEQDSHYIIRLQLVNTATSQLVKNSTYNASKTLINDNGSRIWERISDLFVYSAMYELGLFRDSASEDVLYLCDLYVDQIQLYKGGFLDNIDALADAGSNLCALNITLNPADTHALRTSALFYINLAISENRSISQKRAHMDEVINIVERMRDIDDTTLAYAETHIQLLYLIITDSTRDKNLLATYSAGEDTLSKQLSLGNMSIELAKNASLLKMFEAVYVHRKGEDAEPYILSALDIADKGLKLDVENKFLRHTKARLYKTWASIAVSKGKDPTIMLEHAASLYKAVLTLDENQPPAFDNLGSAYSSLAQWKASQGKPYIKEVELAIDAYKQATLLAPSFHYTYNNVADLYANLLTSANYNEQEYNEFLRDGLEAANTAISLKKEYVWAIFNSGLISLIQAQNDYALGNNTFIPIINCVEHYTNGLILKPSIMQAVAELSQCELLFAKQYLMTGNFELASEHLSNARLHLDKAMVKNSSHYALTRVASEQRLLSAILLYGSGKTDEGNLAMTESLSFSSLAMSLKNDDPGAYLLNFRALWLQNQLTPQTEYVDQLEQGYQQFISLFEHDPRSAVLEQFKRNQFAVDDIEHDENYRHVLFVKRFEKDLLLAKFATFSK